MRPSRIFAAVMVVFGVAATTVVPLMASSASAQEQETNETFTMSIINMGNVGPGGMTTMQATITRWTSEEERNGLLGVLVQQGPDELVEALRNQEQTGFIRGRNMRSGSDRLKYAWETQVGDQRRIMLASDQATVFEVRAGPRGAGHMFTIIELLLDENGEGEGTMYAFAGLTYDEENNRIVVESYSSEPLRLRNVRRQQ